MMLKTFFIIYSECFKSERTPSVNLNTIRPQLSSIENEIKGRRRGGMYVRFCKNYNCVVERGEK